MKRKILTIILFVFIALFIATIIFKNIYKRKKFENNQSTNNNTKNENYNYVELKEGIKPSFLEEKNKLLFSNIDINYNKDKTTLSLDITNESDDDIYISEIYMYGITFTNKFAGHFFLEYNDVIKSHEIIKNIEISIPYKIDKLKALFFEFSNDNKKESNINEE